MKNFDEIYEEHSDMVYNLSLQYVQSKEQAEEITQDVFMSVYKSKGKFRHQAQLKTWIYRITINTSLNYIKANHTQKRRPTLNAVSTDELVVQKNLVTFDHPGVKLEQKEAMEKMFTAINQLSDSHKNVIMLLKIEGLSQKEVAEILNIKVKAVESLFQRAKKKLLIILNKEKENE